VQIRPKNSSAHELSQVEQVMMIVPINPNVNETQYVAQKNGQNWLESRKIVRMRHFHFQDHDRDDDSDYTIAEGFHSIRSHGNQCGVTFPGLQCWLDYEVTSGKLAAATAWPCRF